MSDGKNMDIIGQPRKNKKQGQPSKTYEKLRKHRGQIRNTFVRQACWKFFVSFLGLILIFLALFYRGLVFQVFPVAHISYTLTFK